MNHKIDPEEYEEFGREIIKRTNNEGIIYLPMVAGGIKFGEELEKYFKKNGIIYIRAPVFFDRVEGKITEPEIYSLYDFEESIRKRGKKSKKLIFDDAIAYGTGVLNCYDWLLEGEFNEEDIIITALIDGLGITDGLCIYRTYKKPVNRINELKKLKKRQIREFSNVLSYN